MHMHIAAIYAFFLPNFIQYPAYKSSIKPCDFIFSSKKNFPSFTFSLAVYKNPHVRRMLCTSETFYCISLREFHRFFYLKSTTNIFALHETSDQTRLYSMQICIHETLFSYFSFEVCLLGIIQKKKEQCMSLLHKKRDDDFSGWCNIFISTVKAKKTPQGHEFSQVFLHRLLYSFHIRFTCYVA